MVQTITLDAATIAAAAVKQTGRINRNPSHDFYLRTLPWGIQPFMIAPVLPGETLKNLLLQAKVVSDPVKAPLIGWHCEYYFFYCKLRDLDIRDQLVEMLMDPGYDITPILGGFSENLRQQGGQIPYLKLCLDRIVAEYFRDEGDNPANLITDADGGVPVATFATRETFLQSAKLQSAIPERDDTLPGADAHPVDVIPGFEAHYAQWQHMRALKIVDATFDDWLKQFGVSVPKAERIEDHKPELIRYIKDWAYPSNTVDPATGIPNSALSWNIAERADKDRFFKEPGFIVGVTVQRPKVYLGHVHSVAANMLDNAYAWLPAVMGNDPYTSLKRFEPTKGPLGHPDVAKRPSEAYWVDLRDLFLYGDQFSNKWIDTVQDDINVVKRPTPGLERRYATTAEAKSLFKFADRQAIRQDGVCNLTILGAQRDTT